MASLIASDRYFVVVGMGLTGLSVARFLTREKIRFMLFDTRQQPANLAAVKKEFPGVTCYTGRIPVEVLTGAERVVISPGVPINDAALQAARDADIDMVGDIQLYAETSTAAIVAISGSNGKSTVTTLVGEILKAAGKNVAVGGNLGTPALDLLADDVDISVLELSSFQLTSTTQLGAEVACLLNVSADHLDVHGDLQHYHAAKQRIFQASKIAVVNRDDPLTQPLVAKGQKIISFGLNQPDLNQFGLRDINGRRYLAKGQTDFIAVDELPLVGLHNVANVLAAFAIVDALAVPISIAVATVKKFTGIEHRCQLVATIDHVRYVNDSKATNIGATQAALAGLGNKQQPNIILIAGGDGKGADFSQLEKALQAYVKAVVAIGRDGEKIVAQAQRHNLDVSRANSMAEAVAQAKQFSAAGDWVLLSPACASFDMFDNYQDRGNQFIVAVKALLT